VFPRRSCALLAALALVPSAAEAARPRPGAIIEAHRHNTVGRDWHVQVEVNRAGTQLTSLLVWSQICKATGWVQRVPLSGGNAFSIDRALPDGQGRFSITGKFVSPDRANGKWSVTAGRCAAGGSFRAQDATGHFIIGNPYEYAPLRARGNSRNARALRGLAWRTRHYAQRFDTRAEAVRAGYTPSDKVCPGINHARKGGTGMWGRVLDARNPQSLVYWCGKNKSFTLAGVMYRAWPKMRPPTYGNLLQWHKHGATSTATWMAHVWMVADPVAAFATCVPFLTFHDKHMFEYTKFLAAPGDEPCSDTPRL
jgi:hypothetical protein